MIIEFYTHVTFLQNYLTNCQTCVFESILILPEIWFLNHLNLSTTDLCRSQYNKKTVSTVEYKQKTWINVKRVKLKFKNNQTVCLKTEPPF